MKTGYLHKESKRHLERTYLGCKLVSYEQSILDLDRTNHIIRHHYKLLLLLLLLLELVLVGLDHGLLVLLLLTLVLLLLVASLLLGVLLQNSTRLFDLESMTVRRKRRIVIIWKMQLLIHQFDDF